MEKKIKNIYKNYSIKGDGYSGDRVFKMKLKKRRSLVKEGVFLSGMVMAGWGVSQVALNFGAYSQLAEFKWSKMQASVSSIEASTELSHSEIENVREDVSFEAGVNLQPQELNKSETAADMIDESIVDSRLGSEEREVFKSMPVYPSDNRLYLPDIGKNVPLIEVPNHTNWMQLEENIQSGLRNGVVIHPISRPPTKNGNFFLTGHSSYYTWDNGRYKDVFALLHEVDIGDTVEVFWEGKKYTYEIEEEKVVSPTEVDVLRQPRNEKVITLMTCTPIGTNKNRLIVTGRLIEQE